MSYTVLARRYRSTTFDEVVGQGHVAQTLKRAIASGRIAHAYLFCGTRGTGKTSTARILAKALNCEKSDGPTPDPCGQCESCKAIARGDDIDVIEIDAASNTGVDNVRDIIGNSQYRPARSRFKVYIIDEVHMLSKSAFNALLKTLEEPPSHVKFILATTEPEKVLATILSRCQRYDFRNIPTREIAAHLAEICKKEKIRADEDALLLVAKAGAGSMRDSLSLLDRLLSVGEQTLSADMIEQLLGLPKSQLVFELAGAIGSGDVKAVLSSVDAMVSAGQSADGLLASLVDHLRNLLILRTCGAESDLVEVPGLALKDLARQSEQFDPAALAQDIAILEELRRQVRVSQAGRALLDATLVRLALAEQFASVAELLSRVDGAPTTTTATPAARPVPAAPVQKKNSAEVSPPPVVPPPPVSAPPVVVPTPSLDLDSGDDDDLPRPGKVWDNSGPSLAELVKQQAQPAAPPVPSPDANVEPVNALNLPQLWQSLIGLLSAKSPALPALLDKGNFVGIEDGRAVIRYDSADAHLVKLLERNGKKELICDGFTQLLNQTIGIKFEVNAAAAAAATVAAPSPVEPTAAARPAGKAPDRPRPAEPPPAPAAPPGIRLTPELRAELETDPLVKAILELGGNIVKVE